MKGVMLCNRPVVEMRSAVSASLGSGAWRTGIPSESVHPAGKDPRLRATSTKLVRM